MLKVTVYNQAGETIKDVTFNPAVFGVAVKPALIQQAVVAQQANSRMNLAHTKDKSEVRGGGRKPWQQKGTGRARHGSIRSPLWRGGGITFGPTKYQNFSLKMNKKAKRKAILMGLSDKVANNNFIVLDNLNLTEAKTKKLFEILQNLQLRKKSAKKPAAASKTKAKEVASAVKANSVLMILPSQDEKIVRAAKNIPKVQTISANSLNVVDVIKHQKIVLSLDAVSTIEKFFAGNDKK